MKLIHFQGLNCFHDCVISIVNHLGADYSNAFFTLWSETDFRYDPYRKVYLTKRLITNLETMGARVQCFDCFSPKDVHDKVNSFSKCEFIIVGIDAFYIPWNQFYNVFHGPHYFIVKNENETMLTCFDPTYNMANQQLPYEDFINHTFDIGFVSVVSKKNMKIQAINEAKEIIATHPDTRKMLLLRIFDCISQQQEEICLLAKYVDAMICNRYLYRYFLKNHQASYGESYLLFTDSYFSKWQAVKNGLYKTSVSKKREDIINSISNHFNQLIDEEIVMAENLVKILKLWLE